MITANESEPHMSEPKMVSTKSIPVTVDNFIRAETDTYFTKKVMQGAFGKFVHSRQMASIDKQDVVRMNRDTLYSSGVFDLEADPITITLPRNEGRFMSMQVISQDHFTVTVNYAPGSFSFTREAVGTRYVFIIIRTLANPEDATDIKAANALQDLIRVEQASTGKFETPNWDAASLDKVRDLLNSLGAMGSTGIKFGKREEVNPVSHLIGTAIGWGGNPEYAATYTSIYPTRNDGHTIYTLRVQEVPVDGFWSISVYNEKGFFEKNHRDAYSINNLTATKEADGSVVVQFGGCEGKVANCLPIVPGWNYTVRLYRPRPEILDGNWKFPVAQPKG